MLNFISENWFMLISWILLLALILIMGYTVAINLKYPQAPHPVDLIKSLIRKNCLEEYRIYDEDIGLRWFIDHSSLEPMTCRRLLRKEIKINPYVAAGLIKAFPSDLSPEAWLKLEETYRRIMK